MRTGNTRQLCLLQALKYRYESTESGDNLRYLHEGLPNKTVIDDTSCNQYCNASNANSSPADSAHKMVEVTVPLYLSGCLSPLRQDVFPCVATRGLRIKLELNTADTVLQAIKAPLFNLVNGANEPTSTFDGYSEDGGYAVQATVADGSDVVVLKKATDLIGGGISRVLSPDNAAPPHLFSAGQWIKLKTTANAPNDIADAQIKSVAIVGNRVQLTLESNLVTGCAVDAAVWVNTDSSKDDMGFELTSVRMNVGNVETPGGYLENIVSKVKSGKFNFDIFSYTDWLICKGPC